MLSKQHDGGNRDLYFPLQKCAQRGLCCGGCWAAIAVDRSWRFLIMRVINQQVRASRCVGEFRIRVVPPANLKVECWKQSPAGSVATYRKREIGWNFASLSE